MDSLGNAVGGGITAENRGRKSAGIYRHEVENERVSFPKTRSGLITLCLEDSLASLQGHECCASLNCYSLDLQPTITPRTPG